METPGKLIKYHQLARPENRVSLILLTLGIKSDVQQSELEVVTQLSGAAISRILFVQMNPAGLNLVTTREDSENRRKSIVSLIPTRPTSHISYVDTLVEDLSPWWGGRHAEWLEMANE